MCNNNSGLENQTGPELNSHCFLRSSPENRASPRTSPNHHISNGPFNKVVCELLTRGEGYVCRSIGVQDVFLLFAADTRL